MTRALVVAALVALGATSCGEADGTAAPETIISSIDHEAAGARATAEVFGEGVDASMVVASAGEHEITASDVAAYLRHYPTLSVEDAVEDLVDIRVATTTEFESDPHDLYDARARGRVIAWLRANLWESEELSTPNQSTVEELLGGAEHRVIFGVPELVSATHVLLLAEGEEAQTPERAAHAEEMARRIRTELAMLDRPTFGFDLVRAAHATIPEDDPILAGEDLIADAGLVFPEEYAGEPRWVGIPGVVPEFAEASFGAALNEVVGPIQSEFGWHMIVVDERFPEEMPPEAERRTMAETRVTKHQRGRRLQETVHGLIRASQIVMFEENIALMSMSAEERIQMEATQRGTQFN